MAEARFQIQEAPDPRRHSAAADGRFDMHSDLAAQAPVGSTHFAILAAVRDFRASPVRAGLAAAGCGHPLTLLFRLVMAMERAARRPWGSVAWDGGEGPFAACAAEVALVNVLSDCQRGDADAAASRLASLVRPAGRAQALSAAEDAARALALAGVAVPPIGA